MDWVDRPHNYKDLQGSHLDNFPLKTLKLGWLAFHSLKFQLKCLDLQSYQYKKLAPVLSRFCNWQLNVKAWEKAVHELANKELTFVLVFA